MCMRLSIINRRWQVIIFHIFTRNIVFTLRYILFREREREDFEKIFHRLVIQVKRPVVRGFQTSSHIRYRTVRFIGKSAPDKTCGGSQTNWVKTLPQTLDDYTTVHDCVIQFFFKVIVLYINFMHFVLFEQTRLVVNRCRRSACLSNVLHYQTTCISTS